MSLNRFTPLPLRNGKHLSNRVVIPPMASETADQSGFVTQKTLDHYQRLTNAKTSLVMVEYTYVHPSGRSEDHQLGIDQDDHIPQLTKLANIIHQSGSLAGIQITHAGGKTSRELAAGYLLTPSSVPVPVKDEILESGDTMTLADIDLWKESFLTAAKRASQAGFDLIELHSAHGYGLNQWLSPLTNLRQDAYGGSVLKRSKLLLDIIQEIKTVLPDLLIAVRMPGQDFLEGGLSFEDTIFIAKELERIGVDILDVSSGIGGWRRPRERTGEGYLTNESSKIQSAVAIPVIGVGGIETGTFIDESLNHHLFSLAAVGRAILKEPALWSKENL